MVKVHVPCDNRVHPDIWLHYMYILLTIQFRQCGLVGILRYVEGVRNGGEEMTRWEMIEDDGEISLVPAAIWNYLVHSKLILWFKL